MNNQRDKHLVQKMCVKQIVTKKSVFLEIKSQTYCEYSLTVERKHFAPKYYANGFSSLQYVLWQ